MATGGAGGGSGSGSGSGRRSTRGTASTGPRRAGVFGSRASAGNEDGMDDDVLEMGPKGGSGGGGGRGLGVMSPKERFQLERLFQEAKFIRAASYRYVVQIKAVSADLDNAMIVLERCQCSLPKFYEECRVTPLLKLRFAVQLAKAVRHLHYAFGNTILLHRDIKPANLLVASNCTLRLADFDVAIFSSRIRSTDNTDLVGTFTHMAPEVFSQEGWTPAADIYALGITLWEMYSEMMAWCGVSAEDVQWNVERSNRPWDSSPGDVRIPDQLMRIIKWCTDQDPLRRPNALELVHLLVDLHTAGGVFADVLDESSPSAPPPVAGRIIDAVVEDFEAQYPYAAEAAAAVPRRFLD
jgi:serine/threonine protein kinase